MVPNDKHSMTEHAQKMANRFKKAMVVYFDSSYHGEYAVTRLEFWEDPTKVGEDKDYWKTPEISYICTCQPN